MSARARGGVRPTGIAFGSPVPMIRHRFGGHLRAARTRSCVAVRHAPPLAPSTPWEGTVDGSASTRADGGLRICRIGRGRVPPTDGRPGGPGILVLRRRMHEKDQASGRLPPSRCSPSAACSGGRAAATASKGEIEIWSSLAAPGLEQGPDRHDRERHQHGHRGEGRRRSAATRSSTRTSTTRRPPPASGTRRPRSRTPTTPSPTTSSWPTSARSTRALPSCRSRSSAARASSMISPANTYVGLTKPGSTRASRRSTTRTAARRTTPASSRRTTSRVDAGALWAPQLGVKNVYVLDDTEVYGKGIADVFVTKAAGLWPRPSSAATASTARRPTTRRWPRRSRPPTRTSSTTAGSPRTTPASCGATCATRCRTSG